MRRSISCLRSKGALGWSKIMPPLKQEINDSDWILWDW